MSIMNTAVKTVPVTPAAQALQNRINAAIAVKGAKGMKGFLIWVQAAFPKRIADKILAAAAQHNTARKAASAGSPVNAVGAYMRAQVGMAPRMGIAPGMGTYTGPTTFGAFGASAIPANVRRQINVGAYMRRGMGALGQTSGGIDLSSLGNPSSTDLTSAISDTSSASATPSWMSDISSAISAVGQAYLTKTQISDAQTIFNTNLQRAQAGLSPLPTNPADYGLPSPTVNVGLASGTSNMLMWGGIGLGVILVGYLVVHATKK